MNLQLTGKSALVTGSTAGSGFAIARTLAREGASVVITGRTQDRVKAAAKTIQQEIGDAKVRCIAADLGTARGSAKCIEALPSVDILVNNLGVYEPKPFDKITDDVARTKGIAPAEIEKDFFRTVRPSSLLQRFAQSRK